mgnify:CR=1 FL=1
MKPDCYIWDNFRKEDNSALSYIYHQNVDFLFFYGKKFTIDEDLILDTIQDLFFDLIRKRKTLGETENVRLYLLKSFRRRLFKELEKNKKQSNLNEKFQPVPQIVFSIEDELIDEEIKTEKAQELKKGLQNLNSRQREVLYYKFNCGFDYNQICDVMSISYDSARQMVSRSISILKKHLKGKGFVFLVGSSRGKNRLQNNIIWSSLSPEFITN